jgi:positive regulator of sigma E activity
MSPERRRQESGSDLESRRLPGQVLGLGLNIVASAFLFGFLGHWVGTKVGGEDYLTLLGGFIGAAAGFYSMYRHLVARSDDREIKSG